MLDALDGLLEVILVGAGLSQGRVDCSLPRLHALGLAHIQDVLKRLLHLVVPLGTHAILYDSLSFKHVLYVVTNTDGNGICSVLRHGVHVLEVAELYARYGLVGSEVLVTVAIREERLPVAGVLDVVCNEARVI